MLEQDNEYTVTIPLPEGAIPQHSILGIAYFDTDGSTRYGFALRGEAPISSVLGLIELVKAHILVDDGPQR